jgi:hypothetical protein
MAVAAEAMASFEGVHRRFELRGSARGADFYDDYGHTPTEMAVTLATARRRDPRRLIALVQPHRYQRVQALWRELGASVATADLVVITDIYGASQPPIPGVTARMVADGWPWPRRMRAPCTCRTAATSSRSSPTRSRRGPHRDDGLRRRWMLGDAVRERMRSWTDERRSGAGPRHLAVLEWRPRAGVPDVVAHDVSDRRCRRAVPGARG